MDKIDIALWHQCVHSCPKHQMPANALPYLCRPIDGCRVLLVDGDKVKTTPDTPKDEKDGKPHMDFVEGGNDLEADWVKREFGSNVIILDDNIVPHDWPFIAMHEAVERRWMAKGLSYVNAHMKANAVELALRKAILKGGQHAIAQ